MKRCLSWCWRNSHLGLCCLSLTLVASAGDLNEMSCATSPIKCYVIIFSSTPHTMALKYTWQWCSRLKNYIQGLDISWSSTWLPDLNEFLLVSTLFIGCAIFRNKNVITALWYSSFHIQKPWLYACLVITIWRVPVGQWIVLYYWFYFVSLKQNELHIVEIRMYLSSQQSLLHRRA